MRLPFRKPEFDEVDGEYVIPLRLSEELLHSMCSGWHPMALGYSHLKPRPDGSFDMFVKIADVKAEYNIVRLDFVQQALMAALDLAHTVIAEEDDVSNRTVLAAQEVKRLVQIAAT